MHVFFVDQALALQQKFRRWSDSKYSESATIKEHYNLLLMKQ